MENMSLELVAKALASTYAKKLVVVTNGKEGASVAIGKGEGKGNSITCKSYNDVSQVDATGAG